MSFAAAPETVAQSAAVPRAACGPGSRPETDLQGRVTFDDHESGYSDSPITCNTELVGHFGTSGGFKVERYVDAAGHECAFFDSTVLLPLDVPGSVGTYVLDMSDPANPTQTAQLVTPAMVTPHESLLVSPASGLLAAVMGNPLFHPGLVDVYDVSADCRQPVLQSSTPTGILGHESGFSPDGRTFYASSLATNEITAVDLTNPRLPVTLWIGPFSSHGLSVSADGNRAYLAALQGAGPNDEPGLIVLDVSQIQARVPFPQASVVSTLTWDDVSIPQNALPITIDGRHYLFEIDEFAGRGVPSNEPDAPVGAARIIDIEDERNPFVVSTIKLEVHLAEHRDDLVNEGLPYIGYTGHYCGVPREVDPVIAACSMVQSGLRVFDIRDPENPREIAYFNSAGFPTPGDPDAQAFAMSRPSFVPERAEIWYADGNSGFYVVRLTNGAWPGVAASGQAPAQSGPSGPGAPAAPAPTAAPGGSSGGGGVLARTGAAAPARAALALLALGTVLRRARRA
jgi:hypothetical protein